jgi:uncharacterized protein YbjT (DUF2867 family)
VVLVGPPRVSTTHVAVGLARASAEAGYRTYSTTTAADLAATCHLPPRSHPGPRGVIGTGFAAAPGGCTSKEVSAVMKIAVAGGTGVVGRYVAEIARGRGHEVAVLARSQGVDLTTGEGLDLTGVEAVIDVTSIQTASASTSVKFFTAVTHNLLAAERAAGVSHHLALSIVGIDDAPHGYYAGKAAQERLVEGGETPWTILRATQFHEFAGQIHQQMRLGPVVLVPVMRSQPIAAREVATRVVELTETGPSGRVADLAGPRVERMAGLSRRWAAATGASGRVLEVPIPGPFGRAMRNGTLLARPGAQLGEQTFDQWLTT